MTDQRIANLAGVLVNYSVAAGERDIVTVDSSPEAAPLAEALYAELLSVGAYPVVRMAPDSLQEIFFRLGKPHHFDTVHKVQRAIVDRIDGTISIASSPNTRALSGVDPRKQARVAKATRPLREIIMKKRWCLTLYPTQAYAQDAEMSLREFENFVYGAMLADRDHPVAEWKALHKKQERMIRQLSGAGQIRLIGPDTDLTLSVHGRRFINSSGHHNMPCGEIFTGPVETSAEGHIRFDYPVCHAGREIDGIRLVFRGGKVVEASAEKNEAFLLAMIEMDPGARFLGELGIGTNFGITRFIRNILFDEKIGGTVHLALGQSYAETGGKNQSSLHWDMIKDLRRGGALYVDGKVFQKDGKFARL